MSSVLKRGLSLKVFNNPRLQPWELQESFTGFSPNKIKPPMSFVKIMIHCVWGTKSREPLLAEEKRIEIIKQIGEAAREKNIFIECFLKVRKCKYGKIIF